MNHKKSLSFLAIWALLLLAIPAAAQSPYGKLAGRVVAAAYKTWTPVYLTNSVASGSATITLSTGVVVFPDGSSIIPFNTYTPITVGAGSDIETVTPSAVSNCNQQGCSVTATFSNAHSVGEGVGPADHGIGEAISVLGGGGGLIVVDPASGATASSITSATGGSATLAIESLLSGAPIYYVWNGSAFVAAGGTALSASPNGAQLQPFYNEAQATLSTSGAATTVGTNILPANSIILGVSARVTTTITGCSGGWELGDGTTAARFAAANGTLTAGTTQVGSVQLTTGVASATTGMFQASATNFVVTCVTSNASAGAIRVDVFGYTIVPPQK